MPKHNKIEQLKQIFNEGTLLVLAYQMMLFTDFVSAQNYGYIGNSVVCLLLSNLALNLLATAYSMRQSFLSVIKKMKAQYKLQRLGKRKIKAKQKAISLDENIRK